MRSQEAIRLDAARGALPTEPRERPARRQSRRRGRADRPPPGRFRRWVLRPLLWGLAILAVAVFVLQLLVDTPWARRIAREQIARHAGAFFDREVTIQDLRFELLPLSVEVWGLVISGIEPGDGPFLEVPWAQLEGDLEALQRKRLHLREVRVQRPVVNFEFFADGTNNVVKFRRPGQPVKPRRWDVYIDRLEVDRAEVGIDQHKVRLTVVSDAVRARFQGVGEFHLVGQVETRRAVVRLPDARPIEVAVSARGSLRREIAEIESARISGTGVAATGGGTCEWSRADPADRKCFFQFDGRTDGAVLARLGYFADLEGAVDFRGNTSWRPGASGWRSALEAPAIRLWGRELETVAGVVVADRYGARLAIEEARYGGGRVTGEVSYEHLEPGRPWTVDLALDGVALDRLLADQGIPTSGYAARARGALTYRFLRGGSERGDGRGEIAVRPDPALAGLELGGGAFPLRIEGGVVRTGPIALRGARQSVLARGSYDLASKTGAFDYEIRSADLAELVPLLPPGDPADEPPLWLPTAGTGTLEGTLFLAPGATATDVGLDLERVVSPGLAARTMTGAMRLGETAAERLRLELRDGPRALFLRGRLAFEPDAGEPTALRIEALDWPIDELRPWLDFAVPIDGPISGRLDLRVAEVSSGELEARVAPADLRFAETGAASAGGSGGPVGEPLTVAVGAVSGRLVWDADRVRFERLDFEAPAGRVAATGVYDWSADRVDLALRSAGLELGRAPLVDYLPRADVRGEVAVDASLEGSLGAPRLRFVAVADRLALGRRVLEGRPSRLEVDWRDGVVEARGRLLDRVELAGGGTLDGGRADLLFDVAGRDLAVLAELVTPGASPPPADRREGATPPANLDGAFDGTLRLTVAGPGAEPEIALELAALELDWNGRTLANLEPVRVDLEPERLAIRSLRLGEPAGTAASGAADRPANAPERPASGSELALTGTVGLTEAVPLDLRLTSSLDSSWLELLELDFDVGGRLDLAGDVGGTLERPVFDGRARLSGGSLDLGLLEVRDFGGVARFRGDEVVLEDFAGRVGGGRVALTGRARVPRDGAPLDYRLRLDGKDFELRSPDGWTVRGAAELGLRSTLDGHLLDGRIRLDDLAYTEDVRADFEKLMRGFLQRQRLEVRPTDGLLSEIDLNVEVAALGALRVRNNLADLRGSAELVVRGNLARPAFYGELQVDPGGTLTYNSTDYDVERGRVVFSDPYRLDPELDLVATTRVREFDVALELGGTLERLETRFKSEPPLPDLEVFRLLTSGGDASTDLVASAPHLALSEEEADRARSTSAATFLYSQAASVIGQRVNTLFGFDKFRIDPLTGSGDNLSKARVTVGKRLSQDVLVTYSADPSSSEDQRLQVQWQVRPGLVLILTQNGDDSYSADARWEASF